MMGAGANYLYNEQDFLPYDGGEDDLYDNQQQQQWDPHGEAEAQPRNDSSDVWGPHLLNSYCALRKLIRHRVSQDLERSQAL